ncbi:MAG: phosphoserine phosphatase SerB [Pseudomonadota bacterium]
MTSHVAVLTADRAIDAHAVAAVADAACAGAAAGDRKGFVFVCSGTPPQAPAPPGTDLNRVAREGRQKRVLIADMDSTIIPVECIDELADFAGVKAEVARITEQAMQGALDFEAALGARVALLAGLPLAALETCYRTRVTLSPGARSAVTTMAAAGARTALVSGGFTFFAERVAADAGFGSFRANVLESAGDALTGRVTPPILGRSAKAEALTALCAEEGVGPEAVLAVGDGANDLAMIEAAGMGVAYRAKPAVAARADHRLDHSDLEALLALQGLTPG